MSLTQKKGVIRALAARIALVPVEPVLTTGMTVGAEDHLAGRAVSRRTPRRLRQFDGTQVRRHQPGELWIACSDEGQHPERAVGRLVWQRADLNPDDPRWRPERLVLRGEGGNVILAADRGALVRLSCQTCRRNVQRNAGRLGEIIRRLVEGGVNRIELSRLATISCK